MAARSTIRELMKRWHHHLSCISIIIFSFTIATSYGDHGTSGQHQYNFDRYNFHVDNCEKFDGQGISGALSCGGVCLSRGNCGAFSYQTEGSRCIICERHMIKNFTDKGEPFYFLRTDSLREVSFARLTLPNPATGYMVYYSFTVLKDRLVKLEFTTKDGDIALVVHCRLNSFNAWRKTIFNSRFGGVWGREVRISDPFTLAKGKKSTIHVAILPDKFQVWMDGLFVVDYPHRMPVNTLEFVTGNEDVHIHELSV